MSWASAGVVKAAGSNPAGLSELVEFKANGTYLQGSGRHLKVAGSNPS